MSAALDHAPQGPIDDLVFDAVPLGELVDQATLDELAESAARLCDLGVTIAPLGSTEANSRRNPAESAFHEALVDHDGRAVARVVVGPYATENEGAKAQAGRIAAHVATTLELFLHAGHKLLLASRLHIAVTRASQERVDLKQAELEGARARLGDLERLKASFLSTVSHELRTPLTSIIGYSEMLAEGIGGTLTEEQQDFVQTVRAKSVQLLDLIVKLLDLSRLESGAALLKHAEMSLNDVLGEVAAALASAAVKKGVTLRTQPSEQPPIILGDRERMRQVVRHLAENGIAFTPAGGEVELVVRTVADVVPGEAGAALIAPVRRSAQIRVSDTGPGIAESDRARIFDPFFQIDQSSTREHGGAGLGLTIVRRLIDAHGGTIHVEKNEPQGCTFVVTIPMRHAGG